MELCEEVRLRLRIKSAAFDEAELHPLIAACLADLARVGVTQDETEPLVRQAVIFYCKANFGFAEDQPRYQQAYESLRDALALSGDYGGGGDAVS